jgi:hypothetical protein
MTMVPHRFPHEGNILGVVHGQRDQWTFLVAAELDCIFYIDVDESWQRGLGDRPCVDGFALGRAMSGVVATSLARSPKFMWIFNPEDCSEVQWRIGGGSFCGVCNTCPLRVYLSGCKLSFHLECVSEALAAPFRKNVLSRCFDGTNAWKGSKQCHFS